MGARHVFIQRNGEMGRPVRLGQGLAGVQSGQPPRQRTGAVDVATIGSGQTAGPDKGTVRAHHRPALAITGQQHQTRGIRAGTRSSPVGAPANLRIDKRGDGILELSGTSTGFDGDFEVREGKVDVSGEFTFASGHQFEVFSGATLGGNGTVGDTLALSGGIIAPGASPGTLTVDGDLTFDAGAIYEWGIGFDREFGFGEDDLLDVNGTLTLDTGAIIRVVDELGSNPSGGLIKIAEFSALNLTGVGGLGDIAIDLSEVLGNGRFSFNNVSLLQQGNELFLDGLEVSSPVPEPGSLMTVGLGLLAMVPARRRKRAHC